MNVLKIDIKLTSHPRPEQLEYPLAPSSSCPRINGLSQIAENYDALLCDVWGVLHNGISAADGAVEALSEFKKSGKTTFLLTNAPRPNSQVLKQLVKLGIALDTTFDEVVTSGDVTRQMISTINQPIFHIGTQFDKSIFGDLDVSLVDWQSAGAVLCTGLYDDLNETPEDYMQLLNNLKERALPFICANPDMVVKHGDRMRWCAGALARKYEEIGGETIIIGKPNRPVYEHAHARLNKVAQADLDKSRILAIGDGINTDIAGAHGYGLDVVYISAGIHAVEYGGDDGNSDNPNVDKLQKFLKANDSKPVAWMPQLQW
jgi:HAD superfamily hydrolase (TIGR01459 family)